MIKHPLRRLLGLALTAAFLMPAAQAATQVISGTLPDGTPYRIDYPDNWNGALIVTLDYAPNGGTQAANVELQRRGYATSGVSRTVTGWSVGDAVNNHVRVVEIFTQQFSRPSYAYVNGSSLGGHTGAAALQARPDVFQGGLLQCGGLSGLIGQWNGKLDALFVAKELLAPGDARYPVIDIPDDFATVTRPAWLALLQSAQATPAGKARIALAAVLAQLPSWSVNSKPIPTPGDWDALQVGLYDSLAGNGLPTVGQAMSSRNEINRRSGGNISWNLGVDYDALLARVANADVVQALYTRAGLSLEEDMAKLRAATRFVATPNAVRWGKVQVFDKLPVPALTMSGIGDNISTVASQQAYEQGVGSDQLRQTYVRVAGHCGFNTGETVAGIEKLHQRVTTGSWPDTSAAAMNTAAAAVTGGGTPRFISYVPDTFGRPYNTVSVLATGRNAVTVPNAQSMVQLVLTPPAARAPEFTARKIVTSSLRLAGATPVKVNVVADSLLVSFRAQDLPALSAGSSVSLTLSGNFDNGVPFDEAVSVTVALQPTARKQAQ